MNPSIFSAHQDVLETPIPSDDAGKFRLAEELKRRAKAAVQASQWPDAVALYQKALECSSKEVSAVLHANLALCHGKMQQWEASLEHATAATQDDPKYVKGWWRRGQAQAALKQYQQAVQSLQQALQLDSDNKALQKELEKQQENLEKQRTVETKSTEKLEKTNVTSRKGQSSTEPKKDHKSTSNEESSMDVDEDDDDDDEERLFTKSDHVKGYKIVNGKKTSYFHHELDDTTKQLLGDIAPKKLETATTTATTATTGNGSSAWNQAGTWEEKNVTAWALDTLKTSLLDATYTLPNSSPAPGAVVTTTNAKVTGHASVATVRGKKRYIYELSLDLSWKLQHNDVSANGAVEFPDIDGTCVEGEPYEDSNFHISHADDEGLRPLVEQFVHQQGWREAVHQAIDAWVQSFRDTH